MRHIIVPIIPNNIDDVAVLRRLLFDYSICLSNIIGSLETAYGMFSGRLSMRPTILPSKVVKVGADYLVVPTMIDYGATTGYSLPLYSAGNDEELYFSEYIAGRWDGASNITVSVIGYLGAAEDANDDFKLQLSWANKSTGSGIFPATTTDVEVDTNIVDARKAKYSIYKVEFTIDWDVVTPDVLSSDVFCARLRRIATGGTEMTGEFVVIAIVLTYTVDKIFKVA